MTDTSFGIEQTYRELLLERSGEDRLKMGCSMHQLSKSLVLSAICREHPTASEALLRLELFLRFYGRDFDERALTRAAAAIVQYPRQPA